MKGQVISDWGEFEKLGGYRSRAGRKLLFGAVQAFMNQPNTPAFRAVSQAFADTGNMTEAMAKVSANIQAYATSADFPTSVTETLKKFQQTTYFDTAWERIFDMQDFRDSQRNGFDIENVVDALSFSLVPEGAKAKVYGMSGTKVNVTFDMYGAGLSWSRRLFDDREFWTLENNAIAFRNKWFSSKAVIHYALIDAVPASQNLAWQAPDPATLPNTDRDYTAVRDAETINKACETILLAVRNKGYGVTPSTPFGILAPIQLKGRLQRALGIVQQPFASSTSQTFYNVTASYSLQLESAIKYYVYLPGQRSIAANRMDLTIFDEFDNTSYSDNSIGWGRYGATIADTDQFQRCATV